MNALSVLGYDARCIVLMKDQPATVPDAPRARAAGAREGEESTLVPAPPPQDPVELAVALSRTHSALFGRATAVKVGRYSLIERAGAGAMGVVWSAWDPELGRGVALKLASSRDQNARARARDEGRALARLSHPNVVPIYDVIETDDGVFLVMELVSGKSLRELVAQGATPKQIIAAYREAGEGLAAAHRAGLVHRDFKPDNAIIGADARVRVLDFGLAHRVTNEASNETVEIAGTPRYMAPEQRSGEAITAAVDQYALCVSLAESLGENVPGWVQPIIARGTAPRAEDRYPSMTELLRALALDPVTRWRRRALAATAILGLGAAIGAFVVGRSHREEEPCAGGRAQLAKSWGPEARAAAVRHLGELGAPYAAEASQRLVADLDAYADRWVDRFAVSCRAHRRGELTPAALDRREACLSHRRTALATLAELAREETGERLKDLVVAAGNLPDIAACEDDQALVVDVAPLVPTQRGQATAIDVLLAQADVERDAAHLDVATRHAELALASARALQFRPAIARALLTRGRIALTRRQADRGAADFTAATTEAFAVGDEPLAIEAYARAAYAIGTSTGDRRATEGAPMIEAIARRTGERYRFPRALLELNLGNVALARGEIAAARTRFEAARRAAGEVAGAGAGELTAALSGLMLTADAPAESARLGKELVAARSRLFGEHHPETLLAQLLTAMSLDARTGKPALAGTCRDLARLHPSLGGALVDCAYELMWMSLATDDAVLAREASALARSAAPAEGAAPAIAKAYELASVGDPAAARAILDAPALNATEDGPWWVRLYAADARVIAAIAAESPAARARMLGEARAVYEALAATLPKAAFARRIAAITTLGGR